MVVSARDGRSPSEPRGWGICYRLGGAVPLL